MEDDQEPLMERSALERLIQVMDVCELLPDKNSSSTSLEDSLEMVRANKERWIQEQDNLQLLLSLEKSMSTARGARVTYSENIVKQLESIQREFESESINLGDMEREKHWEEFFQTVLTETKQACHQKQQLLEELDMELDEIFRDVAELQNTIEIPSTNISVLTKLRNVQQRLFHSSPVQTARYLLFDLKESQLLSHSCDGSINDLGGSTAEGALSLSRPLPEVLAANTALESFQSFCHHTDIDRPAFTVVTISGDEGTGKSYQLDLMESYQAAFATHVSIIRPSIPLDLLLPIVGDAENTICSIFDAAARFKSCAILLDNADELWTSNDKKQLGGRIGPFILSVMENFRQSMPQHSNVMIVICSQRKASTYGIQADKGFHLAVPDADQRRSFLKERLSITEERDIDILLDELAEMTAGRSYADMLQLIRQAFEPLAWLCEEKNIVLKALSHLKVRLSKSVPPSLCFGRLDTDFEAIVLSETDLALSKAESERFPFQGQSANRAWKVLQRMIIVPFCRYRAFYDLSGSNTARKSQGSLLGGVLLSGSSGCGKSLLATYGAKVIAKNVPALTVLFVSCTSLIHKEVGRSEQSIRKLFEAARRACPCIIIMEGIENIGAARGNDLTTEGTMDRVLSTLLVELDGADSRKNINMDGRLAIIATTIDDSWVDAALKRPGRFGRAVQLEQDWDPNV